MTDFLGRFFFSAVPSVPDDYYLEIYWGNRLVYRQAMAVHGNVNLDAIVLR